MEEKDPLPLSEIAEKIQGELSGPHKNILISGVAGIHDAGPGDITFLSHRRYLKDLEKTKASAVVLPKDMEWNRIPSIKVENPQFAFSILLHIFYDLPYVPTGIDERAIIGRDVMIGTDVSIYPFVYIEDGVSLGNYVIIYPCTFVGRGASIGDYSIIYPNVTIREGVRIGQRVIIHSGAVIGSDGFGYVYHKGIHNKIPQVGGVIIEDDVEIGANTTIDRATLGNTIIKSGTKIDNLVQIAHNVVIGENCIFAAQAGIAGSTQIGNGVILAGQAGVTGHVKIGDNVTAGGKAGITKDTRDGQTVSGMPAIPHRNWLKAMAVFEELPGLKKRVIELEKKIRELEKSGED